jgi:hypothetical protein
MAVAAAVVVVVVFSQAPRFCLNQIPTPSPLAAVGLAGLWAMDTRAEMEPIVLLQPLLSQPAAAAALDQEMPLAHQMRAAAAPVAVQQMTVLRATELLVRVIMAGLETIERAAAVVVGLL